MAPRPEGPDGRRTATDRPADPPPHGRVQAGLSLRARVLVLAVALAVPASAFLGLLAWQGYDRARSQGMLRAYHTAEAAASSVVTFLQLAENLIGAVAEEGAEMLLQEERCEERVAQTSETLPFLTSVTVLDEQGDIVCSALPLADDPRPTAGDRPWFARLMATGEFTVSEPVLGRIVGHHIVVLAEPLRDAEGRIRGAVSGGLDLAAFATLVSRSVSEPEAIVTVTDSLFSVVTRTIDTEEWVGRTLPTTRDPVLMQGPDWSVMRAVDFQGRGRTFGRVDTGAHGWRVYAGLPDDVLYAEGLALAQGVALVGGALLLLALGLALGVYRGVQRSIDHLTQGVELAAAGAEVPLPDGAPLELVAVARQLNDTLEARTHAEERHRDFLRSAPFGAYTSTASGRFLEVNPALVSMTGYHDEDELMGAGTERLYRDGDQRAALIARHPSPSTFTGVEVEWKKKDGTPLHVRLSGRSRGDNGRDIFEVIVEDVTEQKLLEERSRHQQKVEAVGRLASGVAHDLNNVLTVITGNTELLMDRLGEDPEAQGEAAEIARAVRSAEALTSNLLAFSRRDASRPSAVEVTDVLSQLGSMMRRVLPEDIRLESALDARDAHVWIDPSHLEQSVLNLLVNARDAMPSGGTIRLLAERRNGAGAQRFVVISVADNGTGMNEEMTRQIFEPFFTTKPKGKGTGLGLATVRSIVEDAHGRVHVHSQPGVGTTFEVWLPETG